MAVAEICELRWRSPQRELVWFVVLAFTGAWLVGGVGMFALDVGRLGLGIGVLMVAVAALICARSDDGSVLLARLRAMKWQRRSPC